MDKNKFKELWGELEKVNYVHPFIEYNLNVGFYTFAILVKIFGTHRFSNLEYLTNNFYNMTTIAHVLKQ